MSWFTNLFSPSSKNTRQSSRTAISSTHEAFSLPTSSPRHPSDGFHPGSPLAPDFPLSAGSSAYSYPPQSPTGTYDYLPTPTSSRHKPPPSTLPVHNGGGSRPGSMNAPFPPLQLTWTRLRAWLANEYPELGDTLNYGILPADLQPVEMAFGFALPQAVRDSYLCADGQEAESAAGCAEGLFFGLTLLPLEDVLEEWRFWREVDDDPVTGANALLRARMDSIPPGWIRKEYSARGWIPLAADKAGNYLGVDVNPGEGGSAGQVIVFGREFDTKVVMWRGDGPHGWAKWLAGFVDDLESGDGFEIGLSNDSEGSEDSVGYESYFYDGTGRGLGDGGGDSGTGGMRLTGEYKGWNILEAWADRSVRKWQELGLVPTPELQPQTKGKTGEQVSDAKIRTLSGDSAAEVPIPVLFNSPQASSSSAPLSTPIHEEPEAELEGPLPIISVTKPPAPLPVSLPTADDLAVGLHAPPSHEDLESGGAIMMREVEAALPAVPPLPPKHNAPIISPPKPDAELPPTPILPPPPVSPNHVPTRSLTRSPDSIMSPTTAIPETTDLLADPSIPMSVSDIPVLVTESSTTTALAEDSPVLVTSEDALPPSTVRLVGSSGPASTTADELSSNDGVLVSDAESEAAEVVAPEPDATQARSGP